MKKMLFLGILAVTLMLGLIVIGCDEIDENGNNEDDIIDEALPESVGSNELGGKEFGKENIIKFNADGSYVLLSNWNDDPPEMEETGNYSWNTAEKTVTLKPEKILAEISETSSELLSKDESFAFYLELVNSNPEGFPIPPGTTVEEYVVNGVNIIFSLKTFNYKIDNNEIVFFAVKSELEDTGTSITGCAYSEKASTDTFGMHYLLTISYDAALSILIDKYGQPADGWSLQSHSAITQKYTGTQLILEVNSGDIRLVKEAQGESVYSVKGWMLLN